MSFASLLNINAPTFPFDHDQMHRTMWRNAPGSTGFSALPYLLDPMTAIHVPAGEFNTYHSQAHSDFASVFPAIYWPSSVSINDLNLLSGDASWWQFSNWNLHNIAASVLPTTG